MNPTSLTTSQLKAKIKYFANKLEDLKYNFCEEEQKAIYTKIIERCTTEYILRTGDFPTW